MIKTIGIALLAALALACAGWYYTYSQLKLLSTQYATCSILLNAQATTDKIRKDFGDMPDADIRDWLLDIDRSPP